MQHDWIIIDGHSLLHRDPECAALQHAHKGAQARLRLLGKLAAVAGRLAPRWTIVFDGRDTGGPGDEVVPPGFDVRYSPASLTADTVIERLAADAPRPDRVLVVTSDRLERETVDAAGARSMGCTDFLDLCRTATAATPNATRRPPLRPTLGDALDHKRKKGAS